MATASGDATVVHDSQVVPPTAGRRPRARNWSTCETMCLCEAKKAEQMRDLKNLGQNRFLTSVQKWTIVAEYLLHKNFVDRDYETCKNKWGNLFGDYKAIKDYLVSSRTADYFSMSRNERIAAKLIVNFKRPVYDFLDEFTQQRPIMVPPALYDSGVPDPPVDPFTPSDPPSHPAEGTEPIISEAAAPSEPLGPTIPDGPTNPDASLQSPVPPAPGDRVTGSTGRTRRRRNSDIAGVLRSSSDTLISTLERQMTQRTLFFEQQLDLEKTRLDLQKSEQQSTAEDRRLMVSALKDMVHAMNCMANRHKG